MSVDNNSLSIVERTTMCDIQTDAVNHGAYLRGMQEFTGCRLFNLSLD